MIRVLILVMGNYISVGPYLEDAEMVHEKHILPLKGGDLMNIELIGDGSNAIATSMSSPMDLTISESMKDYLKGKDLTLIDMDPCLSEFFTLNGLRVRTDEDVIGLYSSDTKCEIHTDKLNDVSVYIYYNYLFKGQVIPEEVANNLDLLLVIDNCETCLCNNYEQLLYLIEKFKCDTYLYTEKDPKMFNNIDLNGATLEVETFRI